ncbi:MAG: imelysin family protein [Gammaproteobacteria bacterium]|nr:imelysin family protein [Gammaproteobacteria bacterium]
MRLKLCLIVLLLLACAGVQAYDFQAIADRHIMPAYQQLAAETAALESAAVSFCAAPSANDLQELQQRYRSAFLAWQGTQHLRFGPVQYLMREHRFAFWPDNRGAVGRHLSQLIEDPALLQADFDISQKSVAVQGFSAMERLLFGNTVPDATRCRVIAAIAVNLHQMADGLYRDWFSSETAFVRTFANPAPDNPLYASSQALAGQLLNSLHTELELILTQKLAQPLGSSPAKANGKRAEGWRSSSALPAIEVNLQACQDLYRLAFASMLADSAPAAQIEAAFEQALTTLSQIVLPLSRAVSDTGQRELIIKLQQQLAQLKQLIARDLAETLGLSLGFNSLDGD